MRPSGFFFGMKRKQFPKETQRVVNPFQRHCGDKKIG